MPSITRRIVARASGHPAVTGPAPRSIPTRTILAATPAPFVAPDEVSRICEGDGLCERASRLFGDGGEL